MKILSLAAMSLAILSAPWPVYAQGSNSGWFSRQHNADGGYCCDGYDGHIYDGAYTINADGSVSIPMQDGSILTMPSGKVLPFNPADPNPTGQAVIWYNGSMASANSLSAFCFALGPLI